MKTTVPFLSYEKSPAGSPDNFVLTAHALFAWEDPPQWVWEIVSRRAVVLETGHVSTHIDGMRRTVALCVYKGFFFGVSVAPDAPAVTPDSALHDWIYANSAALAAAWGCSEADVLAVADHWFLALMRFSGFGFKRVYYLGVRLFGRAFHSIRSLFGRKP